AAPSQSIVVDAPSPPARAVATDLLAPSLAAVDFVFNGRRRITSSLGLLRHPRSTVDDPSPSRSCTRRSAKEFLSIHPQSHFPIRNRHHRQPRLKHATAPPEQPPHTL
ncbi:hypothetical protein PIB30_105319, partial [Stylosanthes scabra]|nr:hypothetical protein [Stylosanthes scabra]